MYEQLWKLLRFYCPVELNSHAHILLLSSSFRQVSLEGFDVQVCHTHIQHDRSTGVSPNLRVRSLGEDVINRKHLDPSGAFRPYKQSSRAQLIRQVRAVEA